MTKRKKVTLAYKVGRNGQHKNPEGSQWAFDYERGYDDGLAIREGVEA